MKIGWDMTTIPTQKDGTFEFLSRWLHSIALFPSQYEHVVYTHQGFYNHIDSAAAKSNLQWKIVGTWNDNLQLKRALYYLNHGRQIAREIDVLVSLWYPPPTWRHPAIVIVLDGLSGRHPSGSMKRRFNAKFARRQAKRAMGWLAISDYTKREIAELRGYPAEKIGVVGIPIATNSPVEIDVDLCPDLRGRRYAFFCSAISERKNHERLIRAWRQAFPNNEILLVVAGRNLTRPDAPVWRAIHQAEADGVVRYMGVVTDAERETLYTGAEFVVYPSIYEGFGMPVLEALNRGKTVLTSRGTVMEEVGGTAVCYADPMDEGDIACQARRLAFDPDFKERLLQNAPAVLEKYSFKNVASDIHAALQNILG